MRNHTITLRLSDEEYCKLDNDAKRVQTTTSQYIRALISNHTPKQNSHKQEIATLICELYIMLTGKGVNPCDPLMEELNRLCQIL